MHPLIRGAIAAFAFAALGSRAQPDAARRPTSDTMGATGARQGPIQGLSAICPAGSLPDGDVCVPIPNDDDASGDELSAFAGAHHDKRGRFRTYEQIPRRPDRSAEYEAYRYPVPTAQGARLTMSGYDLDLPESEQRHGRKFSHVGHGGIDLPAPRGTVVQLVKLEHQEGDADVLFVGKLFGNSVITRHTVREGGRLREYVVLYGHLDRPAPGIDGDKRPLPEGSVLGYVGDTGSEGVVHLHFEIRRAREGIDLAKLPAERLVANDVSIVCDPRNVLALR
jgi:murein DD-endopeptidase MepM/ murein hydrolase activator NlpD